MSKLSLLKKFKVLSATRAYSFKHNSEISHVDDLRGIFPQLTTPFDRIRNEKIDWKSLENNLTQLKENNFAGYVVNSFYGENPHLNFKERCEIVRVTRNLIGNKKTLIVSSSSSSMKKMIQTCESMKSSGADYLLLNAPAFYKLQMTYNSILVYYTKIADKSPLPIIINNSPSHTFIDYPAELIIDLANHPNIVGLKESSHNIAKISTICEEVRLRGNIDFSVLAGATYFLLDALRAGAIGGISALSHVLGDKVLELYDLNEADKKHGTETSEYLEKARILQNRLIQPDLEIEEMYGVPGLKSALDAFGYFGGPCRMPLLELGELELKRLRDTFESNGFQWVDMKERANSM